MKRSGFADLPLHGGRVPEWLAQRMTRLGTGITEAVVHHYGRSAFLSRLSDPCWFQAFGAVMGMDWHSSGITTSVMGALKRGLAPRAHELGIFVCGGRGRHSRNTPGELRAVAGRQGFDGDALVRTSRLTARVDNNAIADGFQIYLHTFVVTAEGEWAVVQQGLNDATGTARRYHWHSATVQDFTAAPHTGIVGAHQGEIMNLVDEQASPAREAILEMTRDPARTVRDVVDIERSGPPDGEPRGPGRRRPRQLSMPFHHDVRQADVDTRRLGAVLAVAHDRELKAFADVLLLEQLGPRTLQSLALVAEVVHGAPVRFSDPARFSFAHGGKDGHPFPVPLTVYDETLDVLRTALDRATVGDTEKLDAFRRLDRFVRRVEATSSPEADFPAAMERERRLSPSLGGRSVFTGR